MSRLVDLYHPPDDSTPTHTSSYAFINPSKYKDAHTGKTVLITGAGRGIGRRTALAFVNAGARVSCIARTQTDLDQLLGEINRTVPSSQNEAVGKLPHDNQPIAIGIAGDVTDPAFAPRAVEETTAKLGPIDILINNAGLSRLSDLEHESSVHAPWRVVETSLLGSMSFTQAVLPTMLARQRQDSPPATPSVIINVVSIIGHPRVTLPFFSAYSAAKAALIKYTACTDLELREKTGGRILCFALHPCMSLDTTIARPPCVNERAMEAEDMGMKKWMEEEFVRSNTDKVDLPADTMVALCFEGRARVLSGEFVDGTYDLERLIEKAERAAELGVKKEGERGDE